jgi:hypothetical protein
VLEKEKEKEGAYLNGSWALQSLSTVKRRGGGGAERERERDENPTERRVTPNSENYINGKKAQLNYFLMGHMGHSAQRIMFCKNVWGMCHNPYLRRKKLITSTD